MAQTYTRQSTFADGDTITAALFNNEYNQLVNAFAYSSSSASSTGHRHDGTAGQGGNIFKIGDLDFLNKIEVDGTNNRWGFYVQVSTSAVEQIRIQDGAIVPVTDNDIDLGTSSLEFKDAFFDGTVTTDALVADTADINGGTVDGATIGANSASTGAFTTVTTTGNVDVGGNLTVTGTTTFNGGTLTLGDADTDNIVFGGEVDSNIIPDDDDTHDLGSSSKQWKDIYIDGIAYVDGINFDGTAITSTAAELNILDGVTSTAAELNLLDGVTATTAELNILDGVTSTAAELNILDGVTSTTAELNLLDGVTSTTAELNILDGVTSTATEINLLDGVTATTAELNILDGVTATAAELNALDGITSTVSELNIVDGGTSATSTTLADADRVVVNDNGTMVQVALTDFETYFESALDTLSNVTTVGALNSGSITSGFGAIDNGSSAITTTGTVTYGNLSDGTITITAFVDEDDMSSNSATLVPTQQSVKAYVDTQITAEDLDVTTDSGTIAIDLDSETLTIGGTSNEIETSATGNAVTIGIPAAAQITTSLGVGGGSTNGVQISQGAISIKNGGTQSYVDFYCESSNAHYARLQAPAHSAFSGNITATLPATTGTIALTSSDITGNAATATALATARTIGGTSFDGTANISVALADTATALATARTIHGVSFDGTANIDLTEVIQDTVGAMVTGNTESNITVTYEDSDGTLDFSVTGGGSVSEAFKTISVSGQDDVVADAAADTLTLVAGSNMTITTNASGDSITFASSGGGGSQNLFSTIAVSGQSNVVADSTTDTLTLVAGSNITLTTDASSDSITIASSASGSGGSSSSFTKNTFTGDGSTTAFTLTNSVSNEDNLLVFIDGVYQADNVYSVSGTTLTFATAPVNTRVIEVFAVEGGIVGSAPVIDTMTGDGSDTTLALSTTPTSENQTFVTIDGVVQHKSTYSVSGSTLTFSTAPPTGTAVECITFTNVAVTTFQDGDGDTKIQVEESSDEDKIRFDTGGTERAILDSTGLTLNGEIDLDTDDDLRLRFYDGGTFKAGLQVATSANDMITGTADGDFAVRSQGNMLFSTGGNTERMRIDSSGNVGIGTTSPDSLVDIEDVHSQLRLTDSDDSKFVLFSYSGGKLVVRNNSTNTTANQFTITEDGDFGIGTINPAQRLEILDTSTAKTRFAYSTSIYGEIGRKSDGNYEFSSYENGANIIFGTSTTNGATTERMRITSAGNVTLGSGANVGTAGTIQMNVGSTSSGGGIQLFAPDNAAHSINFGDAYSTSAIYAGAIEYNHASNYMRFFTSATEKMRIDTSGNLQVGFSSYASLGTVNTGCRLSNDGESNTLARGSNGTILAFYSGSGGAGNISVSGNAASYNTTSDARLKDVTGEARGLEVINALNPVAYNWKADGKADEGLIAQEVLEVVPNAVNQDEDDYYMMDYSKLVTPLVKAIQEQQTIIEDLKARIETLEG